MSKITFKCMLCGKEKTEKLCWYKKRESHYCSRQCANTANARKNSSGLSRKEYEKAYWSIPENKERRARMSKENLRRRQQELGDSYIRMMLSRCKQRAIAKGMEFNLEVSDISIPKQCPILGIPLAVGTGNGGSPNSPSLDRINNSLGYIKGNVQVISKRANQIKLDASYEEIAKVADWLRAICQTESQVA
jgi:hypothetical protein